MTKEDRNRADARFNKAARPGQGVSGGKHDRDAALKAVTDNMAKLRALRLARDAALPPPPAAAGKKTRARTKATEEKSQALGDWLAGQQSGGRRT
jgi:hypothetical protein